MPEEVRARYPGIHWKALRDFRNFMTHVYFAVAAGRLWRIVHDELFPLEEPPRAILEQER